MVKGKINSLPTSLQWTGWEFKKSSKSLGWKVGLIGISGMFLIWRLAVLDLMGALLAGLIGATLYLVSRQEPRRIVFGLRPEGVVIDGKLQPYSQFKSFEIFYDPPDIKELALESRRIIMPRLYLPLDGQNPQKIRNFLKQYLPEKNKGYSITDVFSRMLGF